MRNSIRVMAVAALAAASPALAEGGGSSLIQPEVGTIFWTGLTFVVLALLLRRFAWAPLLGALEAREQSIAQSIEQARKDREEAQAALAQQRELLDEARRERAGAVAVGQRDAERLKAEILEAAREQREKLLAQTENQVQASLRQAREDLRSTAVDLAIQAAGKLLARNLDDATQRRLVEEYLADLEQSSGQRPRA